MQRIRIIVVAVLAAWVLVCSLSPLRGLFWLSPGEFDVRADSNMKVTEIEPGGIVDGARIRIGDRFGGDISFEDRLYLQYVHNPKPGQVLTLAE